MATQLFLTSANADTHRGTNTAKRNGVASGWWPSALATARGSGVVSTDAVATVTGATNGVEVTNSTFPLEWISPPVSADVNITGTITANIWGAESNMSANVAINVIIDIIRSATSGADASNTIVNIVQSTRVTELAVTTPGVNNFTTGLTAADYTDQTLNRGDRLRIRVVGDDVGTMATGFTFFVDYNGTTAAVDGDTYVTFTENFSFESAPGGSVLYLTDTASDVATASVDREAWTSRGGGFNTDVLDTAAGWTAPRQLTDTGGGTVVDWFTKQLTAFTLTGMAVANLRASSSGSDANATLRCEVARVDSDGTNATVWASWCCAPVGSDNGEISFAGEAAKTVNVSGDDLAISDGQRLRIRVYVDDISSAAMGTGRTVTFWYDGTSGGASGDTYITLPQTVSEFSGVVARQPRYGFVNHSNPGVL